MKKYGLPMDVENEEEWDKMIREMIFAFKFYSYSEEFITTWEPFEALRRKNDENTGDFAKDFVKNLNRKFTPEEEELRQKWADEVKMLNDRAENGMRLFAKHFRDLWD